MATEIIKPEYDDLPDRALAGYARPTPVQPQRTWWEAAKDVGLDTAAGFVDMGRAVGGIGDSVQTAFSAKPPTEHPKMDAMADISSYLRDSRSGSAKYVDERGGPSIWREPGTYAAHIATSLLPYASLVPLGPWGAPVAGALAAGMEHAEERETARSGNMDNNSQYLSLIQSGLTDQQAREKLFQQTSDPTDPNTWVRRSGAIIGQSLGFGAGAAAAKVGLRGLRGEATDMTSRIMNSVSGGSAFRQTAIGAGAGAATGYAQGAGTDLSRQLGERQMGMRGQVDYGQTHEAGMESSALFGVLGGVGHGLNRVKQLRNERAAEIERAKKEEEARQAAAAIPEIGTEQLTVASAEAEHEGGGDFRRRFTDEPDEFVPPPPPPPPPPDFRNRFRPERADQPPAPPAVPWGPEVRRSPLTPPEPYERVPPGEPEGPPRGGPFEPAVRRSPVTPPDPYDRTMAPAGPERTNYPWQPEGARRAPEEHGPWVPRRVYDPNAPEAVPPYQPRPGGLPDDGTGGGGPGEPWRPRNVPPDAPWAPTAEPYGRSVTEPAPVAPVAPAPAPPEARAPRVRKAAPVEEALPVEETVAPTPPKVEAPPEKPAAVEQAKPEPKQAVPKEELKPEPAPEPKEEIKAKEPAKPEPKGKVGPKGKEVLAKKAKPKEEPKEEPAAEPEPLRVDPDRAAIEAHIAEKGVTKLKPQALPGSRVKSKTVQAVIEKVATAAEERLTKLVEALNDTSLGARMKLSEMDRITLEKLRAMDLSKEETAEGALAKARSEAYDDPVNLVRKISEQIEKERAERKAKGRERKAKGSKPVFNRREQAVANGLRGKGLSLGDTVEGSNQTAREEFLALVDVAGKKIISLKDAAPDGLSELSGTLIDNATTRIKAALMAMEEEKRKGGSWTTQISWNLPDSRNKSWQRNPWYDMLFQLESAKNSLIRKTDAGVGSDRIVTKRGAGIARHIMTDMMVLDLAIEVGKPELWDRFSSERVRNDFDVLLGKQRHLERQVAEQQRYKDIVDYGGPRIKPDDPKKATKKLTEEEQKLADEEKFQAAQREYDRAVKMYDAKALAYRSAELVKHMQKVETLMEQGGYDIYSSDAKKALDFENRLLEMLEENPHYATFGERFLKEELLDADDELTIQHARNEGWINQQERDLGYTRRQQLEKGTTGVVSHAPGDEYLNRRDRRRLVQLDRNDPTDTTFIDVGERGRKIRLSEVLDPQPRRPDYSAAKPARELPSETRKREWAAGQKILASLDEAERIDADTTMDPAEKVARLTKLRDEQRVLAEQVNPWMMSNDYSVGRILDPAADLTKNGRPIKGNLPSGAYVRSVRELLGYARPHEMSPASRPASLLNHVLDVANKLIGSMDVVGLTPEQMMLASTKRLLDPGTQAFYDPKAQRIFVSHDVGRPGSLEFQRTLSHEIVHPLSEIALEAFPEIAKKIENIYQRFVQEVAKGNTAAAKIMQGREHALLNKHEFLSEFYSDGGIVQSALDTIKVTSKERSRMSGAGGFATAFGAMKEFLGDALRRLFLREKHSTLLSDAMVHSLDLFRELETNTLKTRDAEGKLIRPKGTEARPAPGDWYDTAAKDKTGSEKHIEDTRNWIAKSARVIAHNWSRFDGRTGVGLWAHDLSQQARRFEPGMQQKTETVRTAFTHAYTGYRRHMEKARVEEIAQQIHKTSDVNAEVWKRYQEYYDRENQSEVSGKDPIGKGRNAWISPTSLEHSQYRAEWAELSKEWATMPKVLKDLHETLREAYDTRHETVANASVDQLVEIAGHKKADGTFVPMAPDPVTRSTLVKYLRDKKSITPAERSTLESKVPGFSFDVDRKRTDPEYRKFREQVKDIRDAEHLAKRPGVWFPSMRKGDWVSEGHFNLAKYGDKLGGVELDKDNQGTRGAWEFKDEASRNKFVAAIAADPVLRKVKFRGIGEYVDEAGVHTYRATYNPLMLDFFQHQHEAFEHQQRMKDAFGNDLVLNHVEPRKADSATYLNPVQADRALRAMVSSLKRSEGWDNLDDVSRRKLEQGLNEGAVRHIMSASKRATYLPKKYALGSRKDIMQDFLEYMTNTSYSLSELESRNEMKAAFKGLDNYVRDMKASKDFGQHAIGRHQLQASLHRRADWRPDPILTPAWRKGIARILQLSYLDKLVSPMNWVLNGTELIMSGAPMLAGIHGARAYLEVMKAMHDVGLGRYLDGFKDAKVVYSAGVGGIPKLADVPKRFRELTKDLPDAKEIHQLINRLEEYGHLDRDSSMEVGRIFDPSAGKAFRAVDWADNVTRQISANIDNVNRIVLGIAAMRLSKAGKGAIGPIEGRLAHAEKYVGKMAGNYAKYNEAEMFRHPALGPMMQFKRYAQRMTANWIGAAFNSFAKDVPPAEKAAARMQLMYMAGTVMFMSGSLGLPIEPIKGVINAFSLITGFNSDDAEDWARRGMSSMVGKDLGYALTRGVPRAYFNMGIGTRLGLDSMWTMGAPGNRPDSFYASIGHFVGGAPLGYGVEAVEGLGKMAKGIGQLASGYSSEGWNNLRQGGQLAIPFKAAVDNVDAAVKYFGGPQTRTRYGQPLGYQPTEAETAMQMIGLQSGRAQERGDLRRRISRDTSERQAMRNEAYAMYVHAGSLGEKTSIRKQVMDSYNAKWPEHKLTVADFLRADQSYQKQNRDIELHPERAGLTIPRSGQKFLPRYSDTYFAS